MQLFPDEDQRFALLVHRWCNRFKRCGKKIMRDKTRKKKWSEVKHLQYKLGIKIIS
jgi:hypothetical protein